MREKELKYFNALGKFSLRRLRLAMLSSGNTLVPFGDRFSTYRLEINRKTVRLNTSGPGTPVNLLHLSDFHASRATPLDFIEQAIDRGLDVSPDLVCITGDFITEFVPDFDRYRAILRKLADRIPTFASLGNHDLCLPAADPRQYLDTQQVGRLLAESGITCLFNAFTEVRINGRLLQIAGVGDLWAKTVFAPAALSKQAPADQRPVILMCHNPDAKTALTAYHWDIMLSGHSHGGQIRLPFLGAPLAPLRDRHYSEGLHKLEDRWIHVSRGVGNVHGIRINCPPEITLLTIF